MVLDGRQHWRRDDDDSTASRGLGRAEERRPAVDLGELPGDAHDRGAGVDIAAAECDELAPPQSAKTREQNQGVVARPAGFSERVDLGPR